MLSRKKTKRKVKITPLFPKLLLDIIKDKFGKNPHSLIEFTHHFKGVLHEG